jgi:hypothetical protein
VCRRGRVACFQANTGHASVYQGYPGTASCFRNRFGMSVWCQHSVTGYILHDKYDYNLST